MPRHIRKKRKHKDTFESTAPRVNRRGRGGLTGKEYRKWRKRMRKAQLQAKEQGI